MRPGVPPGHPGPAGPLPPPPTLRGPRTVRMAIGTEAAAMVYAAAYAQNRLERDGDSINDPEAAREVARQAVVDFVRLVDTEI